MKCKGCKNEILSYHELIIQIIPYSDGDEVNFWHGDCFAKLISGESIT
jgi:hypothetical protein